MSRRGFLAVALVAVLTAPAYGQRRGQQGGMPPNSVSLEGKVEMVGKAFVRMFSQANQSVLVTITQATKVQFVAKATPDFLRKDVAIEFTAEVDKKRNVKEPVTQLTIISLSAERGPGLSAEGSSSAEPKSTEKDNFAFGGGALGGGGGDAAPPKTHKPVRKTPAVQLPATCVVRGTIKTLRNGKLLLNIGRGVLRADVADNVEVNIDMADLTLAKKGDSISIKGVQIPLAGGTDPMVNAESVSVQGSETLVGPKQKKPLPPPKKRTSSKKDDSGDDAGDSKPDKKKAADKDN
jgi:hypothetical protein